MRLSILANDRVKIDVDAIVPRQPRIERRRRFIGMHALLITLQSALHDLRDGAALLLCQTMGQFPGSGRTN